MGLVSLRSYAFPRQCTGRSVHQRVLKRLLSPFSLGLSFYLQGAGIHSHDTSLFSVLDDCLLRGHPAQRIGKASTRLCYQVPFLLSAPLLFRLPTIREHFISGSLPF